MTPAAKSIWLCLMAAACAAPPPTPASALAIVTEGPKTLLGPTTAKVPVTRAGAALLVAHVEPVLRLHPAPATRHAPVRDFPDASANGASDHNGLLLAVSPLSDEVDEIASALRRFCHHWPLADDLTLLVSRRIIAPNDVTSALCKSFD
ncbi:hypothetical protein [Rhodovastum atsumiense]|uniref:Uncharacterized protein n=1 Tax=Rhodovastum atsumiense TaxID=504468 RepID=A0A5M6ILU7_9PROT|nr:hypothetical protein [Rhodovastum atsumiense]KAA5608528.1 hypothetical protein F1189_28750 [Rhodovastum atsumiense]